jgi:hypothetical protein
MKTTYAQSNFTAGELSPKLKGRFDISRYPNGAKTMENFLVHQAGGAMFRPGTKFVSEVKTSADGKVRLYPFQFSTTQSYMLEIGDYYIRFYANKGQLVKSTADDWETATEYAVDDYVTNSATIYQCETAHTSGVFATDLAAGKWVAQTQVEVTTPYPIEDVFELQFAQSADVLYIVHPDYEPRKLERTSSTDFTLTEIDFSRGPFLDVNITATTITPSADAGDDITLTASANTFDEDHIGSLWRVKSGVVKITAVNSATEAEGDVQAEPDGTAGDLDTGPAATDDWAEGAWSTYRGFPSCVTFYEQRLVFANTPHEPQKFWGSVSQEYENFDAGDGSADDDAYTYQIATEQVNAIRWLSAGAKAMQLGTSGATFSASSGSQNEPITPTNIIVQRDTAYGSSTILPKRIGNNIYYIQRNGFILRELGYSFDIDAQQALDMTLLSDHIIRDGDGATDMAYQQSPHNRIWVVRDDGEMAVMTRNIEQEVTAWTRIVSGDDSRGQGVFESVGVIPTDDGDDEVWVSVYRYIDGSYVRYIEYFETEEPDEAWDVFFVDSGLTLDDPKTITGATSADPVVITAVAHGFSNGDQVQIVNVAGMTELNDEYFLVANKTDDTFELTDLDGEDIDGSAYTDYISGGEVREMVDEITGLDHLEGETVSVIADGAVTDDAVVASGKITLTSPLKAAVVHAGLPYLGTIRLLPTSDGSATGTGQTKRRRSYIATLRLYKSLGGKMGIDYDYLDELDNEIQNMYRIYLRAPNDVMNQPTPLITQDVDKILDTDWKNETELIIQQDQALPLNVLAVVIRSNLQER